MWSNNSSYQYWRDEKLANAVQSVEACSVEVSNPFALSKAEKDKIQQLCRHNNFALFETPAQTNYADAIKQFNQQFGLTDQDPHLYVQQDGLAHITQSEQKRQADFIPYTNKAIGWHTDGYYNTLSNRIRAFSLFCVNPAIKGGENSWIDNEMLYILLREQSPEAIELLKRTDAMTIPAHEEKGKILRPKSTDAIFMLDNTRLYLRYTQRKKTVQFASEVGAAVALLDEILAKGSAYHFQHLMAKNQGIICNNIIHKRSGFVDDKDNSRLLLRGRYFERV